MREAASISSCGGKDRSQIPTKKTTQSLQKDFQIEVPFYSSALGIKRHLRMKEYSYAVKDCDHALIFCWTKLKLLKTTGGCLHPLHTNWMRLSWMAGTTRSTFL